MKNIQFLFISLILLSNINAQQIINTAPQVNFNYTFGSFGE
jgi:hypothetical protein